MSNIKDEQLTKIRLLVMDVDGTMTDGTVYYSREGEELKRFSLRDGMGVELLRKAGIEAAILTTESSMIVTSRAAKLKIKNVTLGSRNKKKSLIEISEKTGLSLSEIAYIGDDVNDIQAMESAGYAACPADAVEKVKEIADYTCEKNAGYGAVREFAERVLLAQNKSITLPESW